MASRRLSRVFGGAVGAGALALVALVGGASPAGAAPVTPNGLCGAKNMVNEHSVDAMREAMMSHTNPNGDLGMGIAVNNALCPT